MSVFEIKTVAVLGAGTMGLGIAQCAALSGYAVNLFDAFPESLERGMNTIQKNLATLVNKSKLSSVSQQQALSLLKSAVVLQDAVSDADLVIEAVPEDLALKQALFKEAYAFNPKQETVWVSNTSSISITAIGKDCPHAERFAGLHFFNPVPLMALVEIIHSAKTSEETIQQLTKFVQSLDKTLVIAKDTPGFIVNRVARPYYGEALKLLGECGESAEMLEAIDLAMKQSGGFKMGPFELMDLIGIDVNFAVTQSVYHAYFQEPRYQPSIIQQAKVNAGHLGRKTGKGFYDYAS